MTGGGDDDVPASQPDPTIGEDGRLEALAQWVYLHGSRGVLSALLLGVVFVACPPGSAP
ncbi:hypothetical protein [Saliphagus infecundisoli]|uniref:Uncharacterized protein n=1 Tax=Saliphagus infecundisoli TaxID=1849069 RepID=A0ABD5QG24_9EURY|nr:hypothetical protein [Saliphagus infecundisoli]